MSDTSGPHDQAPSDSAFSEFMLKLKGEFYDEADDLLAVSEESLLNLEDPAHRAAELANIFRAIHTVKGSGAAVGIVDLVEFAHIVEDCLAGLRAEPAKLTTELTSLLLRCFDAMRLRIRLLRQDATDAWLPEDLVDAVKFAREEVTAIAHDTAQGEAWGCFEESAPAALLTPDEPTFPLPAPAPEVLPLLAAHEPLQPATASEPAPLPALAVPTPSTKRESTSIKVDAERIDTVLDLVGELVVIKSQLINKTEAYAADLQLGAVVTLLDKTIRELQDKAMGIRLTPLKPLFLKMQRLARDLAVKLDKPLDFDMNGEDTELDRTVVEQLGDPLVHLVRNAIDHGIELPTDRAAVQKPSKGRIRLAAHQAGGRIIVRICDDGKGIDKARVLAKALERGLIQPLPNGEAPTLSDCEIYALIMAPGFSTAATVTDLSGRGVGLDVARTQIEKLKGDLTITSTPGKGTSFEISLPLKASITDGMVIDVAGSRYVVPMNNIRELVKLDPKDLADLGGGQQVLSVRGKMLPVLDARRYLARDEAGVTAAICEGDLMAVIFEHQERLYALRVAGILGQTQVVMKPLNSALPRDVVAGAAILEDGMVAMIADVDSLVRRHLGEELPLAA